MPLKEETLITVEECVNYIVLLIPSLELFNFSEILKDSSDG